MKPDAHKRKKLGEQVFDHIQRAIKSGTYAPNERLPSEHALALELEVSRPVIREALLRLRDQGLIVSRRGSGSFVRSSGLRQPLGFSEPKNVVDLQRCFEFRLTLEPEAAMFAAERRDSSDLKGILDALELMRDATSKRNHREDADFMFHLSIARASGNRYFTTAMEGLKEHIAINMQLHGFSLKIRRDGLNVVFEEHVSIYEAIKAGDPELARNIMRSHLTGSLDRLFEGQRLSLSQNAAS